MSRRDAAQLIERHGGVLVEASEGPDLIVVSDEVREPRAVVRAALGDEAPPELGEAEILSESALWERLGLVEEASGIRRLYTPAMMADLLNVPIAAVRRWQRKGYLRPTREVKRLSYFDFEEVRVARLLQAMLRQGCSLANIDRQITALERLFPHSERPLAECGLVIEKGRVYLRRGDELAEPSGQLLIDFNAEQVSSSEIVDLPLRFADVFRNIEGIDSEDSPAHLEELRNLAIDLQDLGDAKKAIEACRTLLMAGGNEPEDQFLLAELLYRSGDYAGARERYFVAIEQDETYVEARANLGCVLAELGELELAAAALAGALSYHEEFADAHYHLAQTLDRLGRSSEAAFHWRQFLLLAPESPWAEEARDRLESRL